MIYSSKSVSLIIVIISLLVFSSCESERRTESASQNGEIGSTQTGTPPVASLSAADLREASLNGNMDVVKNTIEQGVDVHEPDELGRTALMFASFNGHTEIVQVLAENGADVTGSNSEGRTPLMFASSGPFPETVEFLLQQGADPNAKDNVEGWTPLMYAAAEGNRDVVEILLEYEADTSLEDDDGETAVDFARNNGHTEVVTLLEN